MLKMTNSWDPEKKRLQLGLSNIFIFIPQWMEGYPVGRYDKIEGNYIYPLCLMYTFFNHQIWKKKQLLKTWCSFINFIPLDHLPYESRCETSETKNATENRHGSVSKSPRRKSSCRTWGGRKCKWWTLGKDWRLKTYLWEQKYCWVDSCYKMLWVILSQLLWLLCPQLFWIKCLVWDCHSDHSQEEGFKVEYITHIKWPIKRIFMEATFHVNNPRRFLPYFSYFNPNICWQKDLQTFLNLASLDETIRYPRKIDMEDENTPLEKEKHLPNHHFQVQACSSC